MELTSTLIYFVLLIVLSVISGIWLRRKGQPYPAGILNVHKLISIAYTVFATLLATKIFSVNTVNAGNLISAIFLGIAIIVSVVSGGLLNLKNTPQGGMTFLHRISYFFIVIFSMVFIIITLTTLTS